MPLFQRQNNSKQVLHSLLTALSFTSPLESKHVKSIIEGFVFLDRVYINNLKIRGWLRQQNGLLALTEKAKRLVQLSHFTINANRKEAGKQTKHDILLARCLFIILLHLDFKQVRQIKKQKLEQNTPYFPDLVITTQTETHYIEVDTGSEPISTIEDKIRGFKIFKPKSRLIYFTEKRKTFSHFTSTQSFEVQFIYLLSPTLSEDILKLSANGPVKQLQPTPPPTSQAILSPSAPPDPGKFSKTAFSLPKLAKYKIAPNVFVNDPELVADRAYTLTYPEDEQLFELKTTQDDDLRFLEGLEQE